MRQGASVYIIYGASNSALQRATAFDSEQLAHLPFMELFSSGEFPSVVAARRCSSCAFSFEAKATKQKASRAITKKELAYF